MDTVPLRGRTICLAPTVESDLGELSARLQEHDNVRLFRHVYCSGAETTSPGESVDMGTILSTSKLCENTYTVRSMASSQAIAWTVFTLSPTSLECAVFVSRRHRPEVCAELLSLTGILAFEQLGRNRLDVKVGASDNVPGETAKRLGGSLIGVMARQMLMSDARVRESTERGDYALYTTTSAQWPAVKEATEAWLSSLPDYHEW